MRVPASGNLKRTLSILLAVLTALSPFLHPVPAGAITPINTPATLFYRILSGPFEATDAQRVSLTNLERKAVANTLLSHGLPASDFDAAQSWGRSDALFELWALFIVAINAAPCAPGQTPGNQCRTVDQQNAVDWFSTVAQRQAVLAARGAGLEYVKWAGLDPDAYQNLVNGNATEDQIKTFLHKGFEQPKNYARGFVPCPTNERCVTWEGISYTEGFCVYQPPAPFQADYSDSSNISCTKPCRNPAGCNPLGPAYDDLTKWGASAAANALFDAPSFQDALYDVAIGVGFGLGTAAVISALSLTTLIGTSAAGYTIGAAATAIFPFAAVGGVAIAGAAAVILIAVVAAIVAGVYAVMFFDAEAVPGQLAKFIAGAPNTPIDLKGMINDPEKLSGLFSLFIAATEPGPKPGTCPTVGVDGKSCLNAPPIPAASLSSDPIFAVTLNSGTAAVPSLGAAVISPTISWRNATKNTNDFARLHGNWFITQSTPSVGDSTTVQTLRILYTDWSGAQRTAWLTQFPNQGYRFLGVLDPNATTSVRPETCLNQNTCTYSKTIEYVGTDFKLYSAQVIPPPPPQLPNVVAGYSPSTPYEGEEVTLRATGSSPLGAIVSYDWQIWCPPEPDAGVTDPLPQCFFTPVTAASGDTVTHMFPMGGNYFVQVTATDSTGASATAGFRVLVLNVPPEIFLYQNCDPHVCGTRNFQGQLGEETLVSGPIVRAGGGDVQMVSIDWGDGTPATPATVIPAPTPSDNGYNDFFSAVHTYVRPGTYHVTATVKTQGGLMAEVEGVGTVLGDLPPGLAIYPACPPFIICLRSNVFVVPLGSPTMLNGDVLPVAATDDEFIYVDWGDGNASTSGTVYPGAAYTPPGFGLHVPFTSEYTYAHAGTYTATVQVTDQTGAAAEQQVTEHVKCSVTPDQPTLRGPAEKAVLTTLTPILRWNDSPCAEKYKVMVYDRKTGKVADKAVVEGTVLKYETKPLLAAKTYRWVVKACNDLGCNKSAAQSFGIE